MPTFGDLLLHLKGAQGMYSPLTNSETYRSDTPEDGWVVGHNVKAHEREHRRQFNLPGDYTSPEAVRVANSIQGTDALKKRGYSDGDMPFEVMAHMAGSNASDNPDIQERSQHPAFDTFNDDQKLFILKNQQAHLTDQDYLGNLRRFGPTIASGIERAKHLGGDITQTLMRLMGSK